MTVTDCIVCETPLNPDPDGGAHVCPSCGWNRVEAVEDDCPSCGGVGVFREKISAMLVYRYCSRCGCLKMPPKPRAGEDFTSVNRMLIRLQEMKREKWGE